MRKRLLPLTFFLVILVLFTSACGGTTTSTPSTAPTQASTSAPPAVMIAYQYGLSYASVLVLKQRQTLEKAFPNTRIEWKQLASGAAVREAVIANQAQVGALGVAPFLIGWDRGVNWRLLSATNKLDVWLMAKDPRIKSLKDFTPEDKIGVPAPDSIQAVILRKAAQEQLGNANALDKNLVSISHPDGMQALLNGQITAHLTAPPYQFQEAEAGAHTVLKSHDVFGKMTFDTVAISQSFADQYPDFSSKLRQYVVEATTFVNENHAETAQYLSQEQTGKVTVDQFKKWLDEIGPLYDTTPEGLLDCATFMHSIGLMSKTPASVKDLELSTPNES